MRREEREIGNEEKYEEKERVTGRREKARDANGGKREK